MFIPEYTITNKVLGNIGTLEYVRAIAENSVILKTWEKKEKKEAKINFIHKNLELEGIRMDPKEIKEYVDGLRPFPAGIVQGMEKGMEFTHILAAAYEINEEDIRNLYNTLSGESAENRLIYRQGSSPNNTGGASPEILLSRMTELLDWMNSLDGRETHPILRAAIIKAHLMTLSPFERYNETMSNLLAYAILNQAGYTINNFCRLEIAYINDPAQYRSERQKLNQEEDMTSWLGFYTDTMARMATNKKEEILLLSKDTKIKQASGEKRLTARQEKIVEFLQDYGRIQNKDFPALFPNISEDTVLRELKKLMDLNIIVKKGRTKSSRYELQ